MQCQANTRDGKCEEEAVFRCYWPGKTLVQCTSHKEYMTKVAEAMGFELAFEFVDQAAFDTLRSKSEE